MIPPDVRNSVLRQALIGYEKANTPKERAPHIKIMDEWREWLPPLLNQVEVLQDRVHYAELLLKRVLPYTDAMTGEIEEFLAEKDKGC